VADVEANIYFAKRNQDTVRHYAKKILGESFRRWKRELNTKYVKKG